MPTQLYRAGTLRRARRTAAQIEQLEQQIRQVLEVDHPQSVRHIFYRMTDPRLREPVEKSERGYRTVQDRCVKMRRAGDLPYHWIADLSRSGYHVNTFSDAGDFLRRVNGLYRADLWRDADVRCEVWCESRSIASVIRHDCNELAVALFPCGGFSSISFAHEAALEHRTSGDERPLTVFYIGDYDPAGVLIDVSLEAELRRHLDGVIDLKFERLGINAYHVELLDLPRKPRKAGERRAPHVAETVEAEAMPANILRALLRASIEDLLPQGALDAAKVAEASEREHLARMADVFGGPTS